MDLNPPVPLRIKLATTAAPVRQAAAVKTPRLVTMIFSIPLAIQWHWLEGAPSYAQGDMVVGSIRGGTQQRSPSHDDTGICETRRSLHCGMPIEVVTWTANSSLVIRITRPHY